MTSRILYKPGETSSPEYASWHGMKSRCLNPTDKSFAGYGGRGEGRIIDAQTDKTLTRIIYPKTETLHAYAPVQKPKVCVWTEDEEYWRIGCDKTTDGPYQISAETYCPYCGGKIKVAK